MAMDPSMLFKAKKIMDTFNSNHPKFIPFLKAASSKAMVEGSIIEVTVTTPEGEKMVSNIRIQQSDLELVEMLKTMG